MSCIDEDATGCGLLISISSCSAVSSADNVEMDDVDVCNTTHHITEQCDNRSQFRERNLSMCYL